MLTFPIATGQEETRRDGIETLSAIAELKSIYPQVQTTLGVSNISFGLNPAARMVLNSVFLAEAVKNGLDSAIVHPSKIMPMHKISDEQKNVALDLIYDKRQYDQQGDLTYDPLSKLLEIFSGVEVTSSKESRAADLAALAAAGRLPLGPDAACGTARQLAAAMGAALTGCEVVHLDVVVTMTVQTGGWPGGAARAAARAGPAATGQ
jgi:5-methyltetrahydrofolate--homocysteine methyltransferase